MIAQFTLYDIVANVVPGGVVMAIAYWFAAFFFPGWLSLPAAVSSDLGNLTLFLIAAYALGTVAQAVGEAIEPWLIRWLLRRKCDPTALLLCYPNDHLSKDMQDALRCRIASVFSRTLPCPADCEGCWQKGEQRKDAWETLALCYSLILKEGAAYRTEQMKAALRLCRGIFVGVLVEIVFLGAALAADYFAGQSRFNGALADFITFLLVLLFLILTGLFLFHRLTLLFPLTAFEDFVTWYELKRIGTAKLPDVGHHTAPDAPNVFPPPTPPPDPISQSR